VVLEGPKIVFLFTGYFPMLKLENRLTWKKILESKPLLASLGISLAVLIVWALTAPVFFRYVQQRDGIAIDDTILRIITPRNVSLPVFILLYGLIISTVIHLLRRPFAFVMALQGYALLTFFRLLSILMVPLEDPTGIIPLADPFVDRFFYQEVVTKDLFFSGHTSLIFLLAYCTPEARHRFFLMSGGVVVAVLLLVQHAHYFIDVAAAPPVAYLAYRASKKIMESTRRESSAKRKAEISGDY
jgi:hypothetical protein